MISIRNVPFININNIKKGGSSWSLTSAPTNGWFGITSDSTGNKLAAVGWDGIYVSTSGSRQL